MRCWPSQTDGWTELEQRHCSGRYPALLEQVAGDAALRWVGAADHQRGTRLDRVDVLAARHQRRGPHAKIDSAAQPLDGRDRPVAVEIAQRRRHVSLGGKLYGAHSTQEKERQRKAENEEHHGPRLAPLSRARPHRRLHQLSTRLLGASCVTCTSWSWLSR